MKSKDAYWIWKMIPIMKREPKVACIELGCILLDASKNNETCAKCKPRWEFLKQIEDGNFLATVDDTFTAHYIPEFVREEARKSGP